MPAVVHNVEYESWSSMPVDQPLSEPLYTLLVTNCQATCRLFQVTADRLDQIYRPRLRRSEAYLVDLVAKIHVDLLDFYTKLPSCLRLPVMASQAVPPYVYQRQ
ncbi:hypothetical protein EDB80DRAFT_880520 [Ilyonectria destructans]|nr:hypothetical protein EDB80DRAFT_880520 [Ilyonectria destructans]